MHRWGGPAPGTPGACFLRETRGDKRRKQRRGIYDNNRHIRPRVLMFIFPIVSVGFAVLIVVAVILWKSGASELR
jgi:hypothetical protein